MAHERGQTATNAKWQRPVMQPPPLYEQFTRHYNEMGSQPKVETNNQTPLQKEEDIPFYTLPQTQRILHQIRPEAAELVYPVLSDPVYRAAIQQQTMANPERPGYRIEFRRFIGKTFSYTASEHLKRLCADDEIFISPHILDDVIYTHPYMNRFLGQVKGGRLDFLTIKKAGEKATVNRVGEITAEKLPNFWWNEHQKGRQMARMDNGHAREHLWSDQGHPFMWGDFLEQTFLDPRPDMPSTLVFPENVRKFLVLPDDRTFLPRNPKFSVEYVPFNRYELRTVIDALNTDIVNIRQSSPFISQNTEQAAD